MNTKFEVQVLGLLWLNLATSTDNRVVGMAAALLALIYFVMFGVLVCVELKRT